MRLPDAVNSLRAIAEMLEVMAINLGLYAPEQPSTRKATLRKKIVTAAKPHWTQTPAGKRKLAKQMKASWARKRGAK